MSKDQPISLFCIFAAIAQKKLQIKLPEVVITCLVTSFCVLAF